MLPICLLYDSVSKNIRPLLISTATSAYEEDIGNLCYAPALLRVLSRRRAFLSLFLTTLLGVVAGLVDRHGRVRMVS